MDRETIFPDILCRVLKLEGPHYSTHIKLETSIRKKFDDGWYKIRVVSTGELGKLASLEEGLKDAHAKFLKDCYATLLFHEKIILFNEVQIPNMVRDDDQRSEEERMTNLLMPQL